ncbi:nuclear transport factor 2 family protein [uncultured Kordia sp.]|uniref:nuclear transport factor 2 family protein n=1 Tax=uncultured Kordia sp. TaxID=507699 RepID=UPI00263A15FA|nr:nuclear transport factor 2 family protein [uncultured Kordia sp.]
MNTIKRNAVFGVLAVVFLCTFIGCIETSKATESAKTEKTVSPITKSDMELQGEETLKIANAFMGAMGKGDMEAMKNLMHEDMVWQNAGDSSLPWIGPWNGKKAILEDFFPVFGKNFITKKWQPTDAIANGDTAAYFGQMIGLLTNSNKETKEFTYALRVKVKDGKVILWNWFEDSYEVSKVYHDK